MRHIWALLLLSMAGIIVGCGQKGPLVHPDAHKTKQVPTTTSPGTPPVPTPADSTPPQDAPSAAPQS